MFLGDGEMIHILCLFVKNLWRWSFCPLWALNLLLMVWCSGAIWYQRWITGAAGRGIQIALFLIVSAVLMGMSFKYRWVLWIALALSFGIMAVWFHFLQPTGKLDWDPPFIRMPKATFSADGKAVTIENIRDFHYRSEPDYDIRYRTETYKFDDITAMDYSVTHWNDKKPFGHIMLCFTFRDGRHLVLSPEARLERGKLYELLPGFFRRYELIFILATEEDAIQLRTHHRKYEKEEVFLYPTNTPLEISTFILKDMLKRANDLIEHPQFYNGITYNCLSTMAPTAEKLGFKFCTGWRGTFNGYSDWNGYRTGWLRRDRADERFAEYKKRHSVNQYVEHLKDPPDFSARIRPWIKNATK